MKLSKWNFIGLQFHFHSLLFKSVAQIYPNCSNKNCIETVSLFDIVFWIHLYLILLYKAVNKLTLKECMNNWFSVNPSVKWKYFCA